MLIGEVKKMNTKMNKNVGLFILLVFLSSIWFGYQQFAKEKILADQLEQTKENGWEVGSIADSFQQNNHSISWNDYGPWSYTYNGTNWHNETIEAALIENGQFIGSTSEYPGHGFLWENVYSSVYSINRVEKKLKRSFSYQGYQIAIIQQLLGDGSAEITYEVTNLGIETQRIGISQYAQLFDGQGSVSLTTGAKGLNAVNQNSLFIRPDPKTMPNWVAGPSYAIQNFKYYSPATVNGVGWETGKKYYDQFNQPLATPEKIEVSSPFYFNTASIVMKNPGVSLAPLSTASFKQKLIYGGMLPPNITLNQIEDMTLYQDETFDISGTISDEDNKNYHLYLEMDNPEKTLISLQEYKNIPLNEVQNYQITIEGEKFSPGTHTVSIVGIDESGMRSEVENINLMIEPVTNGKPKIQKIKVGQEISNDLSILFSDITESGIKLKEPISIDSTTIGFQWVEATLINEDFHEINMKIPVSVYNEDTTTFIDNDLIAFDVQGTDFSVKELVEVSTSEEVVKTVIKKATKLWRIDTGESPTNYPIELDSNISTNYGSYVRYGRYDSQFTIQMLSGSITKQVPISVIDEPLKTGWRQGETSDFIINNGYKLSWNAGYEGESSSWWYTYNGESWLYYNSIEAALLQDGQFISGTSDSFQQGFLWTNSQNSAFYINQETKSLKRFFDYYNYGIEITQQLLGNNAAEITYSIMNYTNSEKILGVSQTADLRFGSNLLLKIIPVNGFKGINLMDENLALTIIPDAETMPNWAAGHYNRIQNFNQYLGKNSNGVGWEIGKQHYDAFGNHLPEPVELKENQPVNIGDSGIAMKNAGVRVAKNEKFSFKQTMKFGAYSPPNVTLDQKKATLYQDESFDITGTISDEDNKNYRLYLEMDDEEKTLIPLKEYTEVPYTTVKKYQVTIDGSHFTAGKHTVSILGIDEYGTRSVGKKMEVMINELDAVPAIQKVVVGESLSNELATLFEEVKGTNVKLKEPIVIDSSKIGFQWIDVAIKDDERESIVKIPVNIYNPESTVFDDEKQLALDAKDTDFGLSEVKKATDDETLDELVSQKVMALSWNIATGDKIPVTLVSNGIQDLFGIYKALFKGTREDTGESLQKESQLTVGGELKFKEIPENLDFKTTKLNQKVSYVERENVDWKIEIENTIGSNWQLQASSTPFGKQLKEKSKIALVFKDKENKEVLINDKSQKIATGKEENYPILQWRKEKGLLLKFNSDAKKGRYQSEIMWLLSDAP